MNKAERDKLRESVVKSNTCWQTNYIHGDIVIALLDQIDALEGQIADKVAWLVEDAHRGGAIRYRKMDQCGIHWTTDVNQAIRFARREDAEMFAAGDEDAWHIVEHMWCDIAKATLASASEVSGGS